MLKIAMLALLHNTGFVSAQVARRFDILVTEIFPDPTPSVGLPSYEFIEIRNVSSTPFNLKDWKISDENSTATISINYILKPDSTVIICTNPSAAIFNSFGSTIAISNFPSLDNDTDLIHLTSKEGVTIHAIKYNKGWYQNDVKSNGGWTLEMIDTKNPCAGMTNWKASIDRSGGTPGKKNSIEGNNKDNTGPSLLRSYSIDSMTIIVVFEEPVDSVNAADASSYFLDKNIGNPAMATPVAPLFTDVILNLSHPLSVTNVYSLSANNITDCVGNIIGTSNKVRTGLASMADTSDVIINEILFNPKSDGADFIELYNKSKKIINLQHVSIANRNPSGGLYNITQLSNKGYLFFPNDYVVFTESKRWLTLNYTLKNIENILELPSLPSLPDDKGSIVIQNHQGNSIEELQYEAKWHFALIDNAEGISLERIDYNSLTQNKNNWTSAASTAGFGTPGYQNSQFKIDKQLLGMITIVPKTFSPDNDGFDDLATIQYQMTAPGYVGNITIFDANGRSVRYLAKNATLASQGNFRWDGLDDKLQKLPIGIYIVFTEIFNLLGKTKKFKNVVTLARKF